MSMPVSIVGIQVKDVYTCNFFQKVKNVMTSYSIPSFCSSFRQRIHTNINQHDDFQVEAFCPITRWYI